MRSNTVAVDVSMDWMTARDVQRRFMQGSNPKNGSLDYSAECRQVRELGGDYYDFMSLQDGRLALAIGDASGKSLAAALMISSVQSSLRTAALFVGNDGAAMLGAVNRQAHELSSADRYATLFYGIFDGATRTLRYVNAGHVPPMVLRTDGSATYLDTGGAPVGMFPDWTYKEETLRLNPDDLLVAYTDGLTENENSSGEEWGAEGLQKAVAALKAQCAVHLVRGIFKSMDEFSQGRQSDDATVAALRVS
jgi:phosphoserine phosphatase RsbU/P